MSHPFGSTADWIQSLARVLATSTCDLGDERDVFRTLKAAGIPDGDIIIFSDHATEAARNIRALNAAVA